MNSVPIASIVIVAHGKREVTERCLASLERELGSSIGAEYELVLVDNDSPDDTAELFDAWRDRATVVSLQENRNFSGGCNAGAAAARGSVLVFLNNDTEVLPSALEGLARTALEPGVGAAGPRLLYSDGTIQHAGVAMIRVRGGMVVPHHIFHHQAGDLPAARCVYELDAVTGACLAIRRELFHELGGFDEAYANGWEDVDLCLRVRVAGQRVVYRGDLHLIHDEGQTRGKVMGVDPNIRTFYERWLAILEPDDELVARLFDGAFPAPRGPSGHADAALAFEGHVTGLSCEGAELRSLLALCERAGLPPAARNLEMPFVEPRLTEPERALVERARARQRQSEALTVRVPVGRTFVAPSGGVLRLGALPERSLPAVDAVWAATTRLRDALVEGGLDPARVTCLPPSVPSAAPGPGGDGILVLLPGHDPVVAAKALTALSGCHGSRLRALPSVSTPALERLAADRFPAVELLRPCASEVRFRELAATCDVVVSADCGDVYERRALIAAGAGAAVVTPSRGPAAEVLGADASVIGGDFRSAPSPTLVRALEQALEQAGDRDSRAAMVDAVCGEAHATELLLSQLDGRIDTAVLAG